MLILRKHIIFRIVTLVVVVCVLLPSALTFSHAFNHHTHEICYGENATHLHKQDVKCKFYHFKLNTPYTIPEYKTEFYTVEHNYQLTRSEYLFLSTYQSLHFSLRGPPQLI